LDFWGDRMPFLIKDSSSRMTREISLSVPVVASKVRMV
jgi:hypothetical protein